MNRLMEKNTRAVIETPDGKAHPIAPHRQRMEIKAFVAPAGL
jgi:hypothetical protein